MANNNLTKEKVKQKELSQNIGELFRLLFNSAAATHQITMSASQDFDTIILNKSEIIKLRLSRKRVVGIYFLLEVDTIVYIGKSSNLLERLAKHCKNKDKTFDHCTYMMVRKDKLDEIEQFLISRVKPKYNMVYAIK